MDEDDSAALWLNASNIFHLDELLIVSKLVNFHGFLDLSQDSRKFN